MASFWQEIASAVISSSVAVLLAWVAKAAWDRKKDRIEELEEENEDLRSKREEESKKLMETVIKELKETRHVVAKHEIKMEEFQKIPAMVERLSRSVSMLQAWRNARVRDEGDEDGSGSTQ